MIFCDWKSQNFKILFWCLKVKPVLEPLRSKIAPSIDRIPTKLVNLASSFLLRPLLVDLVPHKSMKNVIKDKLVNSMKGNRSLLHWYKGKTTINKMFC